MNCIALLLSTLLPILHICHLHKTQLVLVTLRLENLNEQFKIFLVTNYAKLLTFLTFSFWEFSIAKKLDCGRIGLSGAVQTVSDSMP